jgi:hypothetical protein
MYISSYLTSRGPKSKHGLLTLSSTILSVFCYHTPHFLAAFGRYLPPVFELFSKMLFVPSSETTRPNAAPPNPSIEIFVALRSCAPLGPVNFNNEVASR